MIEPFPRTGAAFPNSFPNIPEPVLRLGNNNYSSNGDTSLFSNAYATAAP
jgi:hypothetical protein